MATYLGYANQPHNPILFTEDTFLNIVEFCILSRPKQVGSINPIHLPHSDRVL